jgi:heme exporter protein C
MTREEKLGVVALVAMAAAAGFIVLAPQDTVQGPVQKIFYLHVATAIAAYACFAAVLAGSVGYLWRSSIRLDRLARASAPVGLVMTCVTLSMGTIWANPIWGWDPTLTWDARFTSTVVLGVIYAGYVLVRRLSSPGPESARFAAVVGIIGFIDVPIVHFSVTWWKTLHPGPVIATNQLPAEMLIAFLVTMMATLLLAGAMVAMRYRIEAAQEESENSSIPLTTAEVAQ